MKWVYAAFGRRVREARRKQHLTQAYVADHVGLSRTSITNIERGRQRIPLHLIYPLAEALRTEPADLLPDNPREEDVFPAKDLRGLDKTEREWATSVIEKGTESATSGGNRDAQTRNRR